MMFEHLDDPDPFHPDDAWFRSVERRGRRLRRRRRAAAGSVASLTLVLLVALTSVAWVNRRVDDIDRLDLDLGTASSQTGGSILDRPFNVLVVGTDADLGGTPGARADSIAVVRIDPTVPDERRVTVVSIPRDTVLTDPARPVGDQLDRASGVFGARGAQGLVDALGHLGVAVDHVAVVSPEGFRRVADAVGGIEVDVLVPIRDEHTGLRIDGTGCQRLDGATTLALARSRHLEHLDATTGWTLDPSSDLGRVTRGQDLAASLVGALLDAGPTALPGLLDAAGEGLALDTSWTRADLVDLARWASSGDPSLTAQLLPTYPGWLGDRAVLWTAATPPDVLGSIGLSIDAARLPVAPPGSAAGEVSVPPSRVVVRPCDPRFGTRPESSPSPLGR